MIYDQIPQKSHLLNIAIVMLVIFICIQLYAILAYPSTRSELIDLPHENVAQTLVQINIFNGSGIDGVGNMMTKFCREQGYDVVEMGNYQSFDVETSLVVDRSGKLEHAKQLAKHIGISSDNVVQLLNKEQMVAASIIIGKDFNKLFPWNKK